MTPIAFAAVICDADDTFCVENSIRASIVHDNVTLEHDPAFVLLILRFQLHFF